MQILQRLYAGVSRPETLATAAGLKQALADSGILLESKLTQSLERQAPPSVAHDLKANLGQLIAQLQTLAGSAPAATDRAANLPATAAPHDPALLPLLRAADSALARIELNQLTMINGETGTPTALCADLPVREHAWHGVLQLRVEEDATGQAGRAAGERSWSVWLRFDFESLGPVQARVSLAGDAVTVGLWAERAATAAWFNRHLAELDGTLRQAGLAAHDLHCQTGRPATPASPPAPDRLLDERA
jgi:hypothetical protein